MGLYFDEFLNAWRHYAKLRLRTSLSADFSPFILGWLPAGGWNGGSAMYIILPVASLTIAYVAGIARIMRGSMIEVLHSNFIRTAKAKGLSTSRII